MSLPARVGSSRPTERPTSAAYSTARPDLRPDQIHNRSRRRDDSYKTVRTRGRCCRRYRDAPLNRALIYRGYEIHDLAENASFEDVAYLLLHGDKPTAESRFFKDELIANRALSPQAIQTLQDLRPAAPASARRCRWMWSGPSFRSWATATLTARTTPRGQPPQGQTHRRQDSDHHRAHAENIDGKEIIARHGRRRQLSHAANLLYLMTGERPTAEAERSWTSHSFSTPSTTTTPRRSRAA